MITQKYKSCPMQNAECGSTNVECGMWVEIQMWEEGSSVIPLQETQRCWENRLSKTNVGCGCGENHAGCGCETIGTTNKFVESFPHLRMPCFCRMWVQEGWDVDKGNYSHTHMTREFCRGDLKRKKGS